MGSLRWREVVKNAGGSLEKCVRNLHEKFFGSLKKYENVKSVRWKTRWMKTAGDPLKQRHNYTQKRNLIPHFFFSARSSLAYLTWTPTSKGGHSRKSGMNKNDKRKEELNMATFWKKERKTKWAAVALTRGRNRLSLFCNLDILHPTGYLIHSCFMSCLSVSFFLLPGHFFHRWFFLNVGKRLCFTSL